MGQCLYLFFKHMHWINGKTQYDILHVDRKLYRKFTWRKWKSWEKKIPKATRKHVLFGMGLSIETCRSSIPELLGEMLWVTGSTHGEFLENLSKVHSNIAELCESTNALTVCFIMAPWGRSDSNATLVWKSLLYCDKGKDRRRLSFRKFLEDHHYVTLKRNCHEVAVGLDDNVSLGSAEVHCNVNILSVKIATLTW